MRAVEKSVLGCDYGGTSWTTIGQASQIIDTLELGPGVHCLDIGAGSGWPGLFMSDESGCAVTLLDLPVNALVKARDRAQSDGIADRVGAVAASGDALPFGDATFKAISHSDVLCCLPDKVRMLQECRRVAVDASKMLFSVISVAPGLATADHRRTVDAGPPFVDASDDYGQLLAESGWRLISRDDCTVEYRSSLEALVGAFEEDGELVGALGEELVREARIKRQEQIAVIDEGMLVREIFFAATD